MAKGHDFSNWDCSRGDANRKEPEVEVTDAGWSHCKTEAISSYARFQIPK